jgi:predicted CoA-substrate-specific enzyme activase
MPRMRIGLDLGSTTIKAAVLDDAGEMIFQKYARHYSLVSAKVIELLEEIERSFPGEETVRLSISGSAGLGIAQKSGISFVQEVYATKLACARQAPDADVAIELGGEDAKILFLSGQPDARMNGSCAGGTGAFIDQMAALLGVSAGELNEMAKAHERVYTIASRCGVFAKSDVQPLINQGAKASDLAASIFAAVVIQTIGGLAQGRAIKGNVLYLGGPLYFLSELRKSFDLSLAAEGICPENSLYFVALGAALSAREETRLRDVLKALKERGAEHAFASMEPLFKSEEEYQSFFERHKKGRAPRRDFASYDGPVFLGIDAGSTTLKFAVLSTEGELLKSLYQSNSGNPIPLVKAFFEELYAEKPGLRILRAAATGYGEGLIQSAFCLDHGLVETMAHLKAARHLQPETDFILDIGGQDMKCMRLRGGHVENLYLNEACSSGCGSFLQGFAEAMGEKIADFAKLGLFADRPVDLGSRCTVFMNSSVKQAQKDGASKENISAGLSISVIKNALYKVIRPSSKEELGSHIVVQGGTFLNDAVLRAFEKEMSLEVLRPDIAGLMGAYGAALYARERYGQDGAPSTTLNEAAVAAFEHEVMLTNCGLCENHCPLTVNRFADGRRFLSGNRCERPLAQKEGVQGLNIYEKKLELIQSYQGKPGSRGKIGLPFGLNFYELLPFWHGFFTELQIETVLSPLSSRDLYLLGHGSVPSDTVCYPAKLMHGHVQWLIDQGIGTIFYPCGSYNMDDGLSDNCYNCPVVAFYPEVIAGNQPMPEGLRFIKCYVGLHRRRDLPTKLYEALKTYYPDLAPKEVRRALKKGFAAYEAHMAKISEMGEGILRRAREEGRPVVILAGRPYHIDPEINHGIDRLLSGFGAAVLSEDAILRLVPKGAPKLRVLNQWTYHARLYASARLVAREADLQLVQMVSFGCGCDAITGDECRRILEEAGKIYTQIKIDEIENLGAARIRLRSFFAAAGLEKQGGAA